MWRLRRGDVGVINIVGREVVWRSVAFAIRAAGDSNTRDAGQMTRTSVWQGRRRKLLPRLVEAVHVDVDVLLGKDGKSGVARRARQVR